MQSVPITTKVVSSNHTNGNVYSIKHYVIKFVVELQQAGVFIWVLQFPPPKKNDRHDITEILLKVALNTNLKVYIIKSENIHIYIYKTRLKDIQHHKNNNGLRREQYDITTASLPGLPSAPFLLQSSLIFNTFLTPVHSRST